MTATDVPDIVLRCTGLRCSYGRFDAVHGIDLQVRRGELFALLGTNGAGKTTTLETIQGHRRAAGGSVRVLGLDPYRQRRRLAAAVGVVLQESGSPPDLTAAETLRLWQRLRRHAGTVEPLLDEVQLRHRAAVRVRQLSGGERRRLDLAVALVGDPALLFLDEPTTGLDPQSREHTWDVVRDRIRRGTSVLLTTHYLEEAQALADRVAIMDDGRIVAGGTLDEVLGDQPARIRCTLPAGCLGSVVPGLTGRPGWAHRGDRAELTVVTGDLQHDLAVLAAWAAGQGVELGRLEAVQGSLDDVFRRIAAPAGSAVAGSGDGGPR